MTVPVPNSPEPTNGATDALDSVVVVFEGPGDKTRRPRRPHIPLEPPPAAPSE